MSNEAGEKTNLSKALFNWSVVISSFGGIAFSLGLLLVAVGHTVNPDALIVTEILDSDPLQIVFVFGFVVGALQLPVANFIIKNSNKNNKVKT